MKAKRAAIKRETIPSVEYDAVIRPLFPPFARAPEVYWRGQQFLASMALARSRGEIVNVEVDHVPSHD